jgi:hypothetical protein
MNASKSHALPVKYGTTAHAQLGNCPPATWRYEGTLNGSHVAAHVKHPSQSRAYPDQYLTREDVIRIFGGVSR